MHIGLGFAVVLVAGLAAPVALAAERMSDKAVGSISLRPPVPLATHALNAMLRADSDKDGTLSPEELEHYDLTLSPRFREVDRDRDGRLTFYEFEKLLPSPSASASR